MAIDRITYPRTELAEMATLPCLPALPGPRKRAYHRDTEPASISAAHGGRDKVVRSGSPPRPAVRLAGGVQAAHNKPFQSRAGMFRSLPFVTMRQEQDQPAQSAPLILGAGNELIHDRLGGVPEIPILRLPQNQPIRIIEAVPVLETKHPRFGKRAVEN